MAFLALFRLTDLPLFFPFFYQTQPGAHPKAKNNNKKKQGNMI